MSKFLFSALALAVVLSLLASYAVAMTVVPLFCAKFIKAPRITALRPASAGRSSARRSSLAEPLQRLVQTAIRILSQSLRPRHQRSAEAAPVAHPVRASAASSSLVSFLFPLLDFSFFPRTDPGQFMIERQSCPSGTRLGVTEEEIAKVEDLVRKVVAPDDLGMIVSNIGSTPDFSAIYTSNSAHAHRHRAGEPQGRPQDRQLRIHGARAATDVRRRCRRYRVLPIRRLVDAVLSLGMPAPIDVQVAGSNLKPSYSLALRTGRARFARSPASATSISRRISIIPR